MSDKLSLPNRVYDPGACIPQKVSLKNKNHRRGFHSSCYNWPVNKIAADSRIVTSNQSGLHKNLELIVKRHLSSTFLRPYPDHSLRVFEQAQAAVDNHSGPIILDSFCGVGESTSHIATKYPDALVIGIDKSKHRLDRHSSHNPDHSVTDNYLLLQADVDDFWRLAVDAEWRLSQHFILYPNPWPKANHFKRRVHGSPLLSTLLTLGGDIELRSNWQIYVQEFTASLTLAGRKSRCEALDISEPITPFERKYLYSEHPLWVCRSRDSTT